MTICELQFRCDKRWEELAPTANASARYCDDCQKAVFMVKTQDAFALAVALGRCVGIADDNDFIGVIGEPSFEWMEPGFFEGLSLRAIKPISASRLPGLRLLFPQVFDRGPSEAQLLAGHSVVVPELGLGSRELLLGELKTHAPELAAANAA